MPNFRTNNITLPSLPFKKDGVEFLRLAKGRSCDLLLVDSGGERFFVTIRPKGSLFVIKGEKNTNPTKITHLQLALKLLKESFCDKILSDCTSEHNSEISSKMALIKDSKEILRAINNSKFGKIYIEIGFGSGRHLLYQAQNNPDILVVGIEIYKPSLVQVSKRAVQLNLDNVLLVNSDARTLLGLIDSNLIDKIFLHFPVPWLKACHRRVISDEFVTQASRTLKKGGKFELRTDCEEYARYGFEKFLKFKSLHLEIFKNRNLDVSSKYEDRWKRMDKDIYDLIFECDEMAQQLGKSGEFGFDKKVKKPINFENTTYKGEGWFVHFEEIYTFDDNGDTLIKLAFGGFSLPESYFLLISDEGCEYLIKQPLPTKENLCAHEKIGEMLYG